MTRCAQDPVRQEPGSDRKWLALRPHIRVLVGKDVKVRITGPWWAGVVCRRLQGPCCLWAGTPVVAPVRDLGSLTAGWLSPKTGPFKGAGVAGLQPSPQKLYSITSPYLLAEVTTTVGLGSRRKDKHPTSEWGPCEADI